MPPLDDGRRHLGPQPIITLAVMDVMVLTLDFGLVMTGMELDLVSISADHCGDLRGESDGWGGEVRMLSC